LGSTWAQVEINFPVGRIFSLVLGCVHRLP
jgi:hypothetical protein